MRRRKAVDEVALGSRVRGCRAGVGYYLNHKSSMMVFDLIDLI